MKTGSRFLLALFALAGSLSFMPAGAQLIVGEVRLQGSEEVVEGVDVGLLDPSGVWLSRSVSDSTGTFVLSVPGPGSYQLLASRLGLTTARSRVEVGEKEIVEVEVIVNEKAIALEPIVVVGRRRIRRGTLDEFYERMERMKRKGVGTFLTREEIEKHERTNTSLLLQTLPGISARPAGGVDYRLEMQGRGERCTPTVYLDGQPLAGPQAAGREVSEGASTPGLYPWGDGGGGAARPRYSSILTMDLEGVEVYRYYDQVDDYWTGDCGAIFLWRREDWGNPFDWGRLFLLGGVAGLLGLLVVLF